MENDKINDIEILMPINNNFLEVFKVFMDDNQKEKIRANNVRQYIEGIIDLLLKDKILSVLGDEPYESLNWKRKIKIIENNYDTQIAEKIREIFRVGGNGSHFNGKVNDEELHSIIDMAIHIVEDIFVIYFRVPEHKFGNENIFTIFSMLPLKHRIYILEKLSIYDADNKYIVDRLSLAYAKNGEKEKAKALLDKSLKAKIIDKEFYQQKLKSLKTIQANITDLYKQNANYEQHPEYSKAIIDGSFLVVGLPTSNNIFDTQRAMETFKEWFENYKNKYPEFINLFFYLMQTDNRVYKTCEK